MGIHLFLASEAAADDRFNLAISGCQSDNYATSEERLPYEEPALEFGKILSNGNTEDLYNFFSDDYRKKVKLSEFVKNFSIISNLARTLTGLHIAHSYKISLFELRNGNVIVNCTSKKNGNVGDTSESVTILAHPLPIQAHVIIEGASRNNLWAFDLLLSPDPKAWKIDEISMKTVTILDRTAADFRQLARQELEHGHLFNARVLYNTAIDLSMRGPLLQLGILPDIQKEMNESKAPNELAGKPPFEWKLSGENYFVLDVSTIAVAGHLALAVVRSAKDSEDDFLITHQNRIFMDLFKESHPEYKYIYDGLVIRAIRTNNTSVDTLDYSFGNVKNN